MHVLACIYLTIRTETLTCDLMKHKNERKVIIMLLKRLTTSSTRSLMAVMESTVTKGMKVVRGVKDEISGMS